MFACERAVGVAGGDPSLPAGSDPLDDRDVLGGGGAERHASVDRSLRRFRACRVDASVFNKTRANLDENPWAQVVVVEPQTSDQYLLDLRFLHTETEGATFDAVKANLDAVASQTGMTDVFRLRGVDIHRVLRCVPFGEIARPAAVERGGELKVLASLDEFVRRLALCADYADAARAGLEALEDLFGFAQSILLVADERGDRVFAVASNGYPLSAAGAEVRIGLGVIGTAAERRRVVCVPHMARSRSMQAAIQQSVDQTGAGRAASTEIPLPGLDLVQSAAAVPLVVHGALAGVLYLESDRPGGFGPGDERLLRILGGHIGAALAVLQADRRESAPSKPPPAPVPSRAEPSLRCLLPGRRQRVRRRCLRGQGRSRPDPVEAAARTRGRWADSVHQPGAAPG